MELGFSCHCYGGYGSFDTTEIVNGSMEGTWNLHILRDVGRYYGIMICIHSGHFTYYSTYVHRSLYMMTLTRILSLTYFYLKRPALAICEEPIDFERVS